MTMQAQAHAAPEAARAPARRERQLPAVARRLNAAARAYGDAKVALDQHQGANHGLAFTQLLLKVRAATVELSAAARAFAADDRAKEKADAGA